MKKVAKVQKFKPKDYARARPGAASTVPDRFGQIRDRSSRVEYPRRGRGAAATRLHGMSTSQLRHRRDPSASEAAQHHGSDSWRRRLIYDRSSAQTRSRPTESPRRRSYSTVARCRIERGIAAPTRPVPGTGFGPQAPARPAQAVVAPKRSDAPNAPNNSTRRTPSALAASKKFDPKTRAESYTLPPRGDDAVADGEKSSAATPRRRLRPYRGPRSRTFTTAQHAPLVGSRPPRTRPYTRALHSPLVGSRPPRTRRAGASGRPSRSPPRALKT